MIPPGSGWHFAGQPVQERAGKCIPGPDGIHDVNRNRRNCQLQTLGV